MALVLNDRVRETTSVVGTGAVTLLGYVTGYQAFSVIGDGNTCYYGISDQIGANWEVGIGTYTASGNTLARTTVLRSSNSNNLVSFTAGTKDVFVTYPAETAMSGGGGGTYPTTQPSLNLDFANTKLLDPRITFVRNSTAAYYDGQTSAMAEQNLFLYSQAFSTYPWAIQNGASLLLNNSIAPDGTTTASLLTFNGQYSSMVQGASLVSGATYTLSFWAKTNTNTNLLTVYVDSPNIQIDTYTPTSSWVRYSFTFTSSVNAVRGIYPAQDRNTSGFGSIYIWGAQLEQRSSATAYTPTTTAAITNYIPQLMTAPAGVARFDCDPITRNSLGLLIEESRVNLLTYSSNMATAPWGPANLVLTQSTIISPDGTLNGITFTRLTTTSAEAPSRYSSAQVVSAPYTVSVYAKVGTTNNSLYIRNLAIDSTVSTGLVKFNLTAGTIDLTLGSTYTGKAFITAVGNGWYRCSISGTTPATIVNNLVDIGVTSSGTLGGTAGDYLFAWGAQLEAGSFATSYIPTVASTVTRAADAASMTGTNFSSWWNVSQSTFVVEFDKPNLTNVGTLIGVYGGVITAQMEVTSNAIGSNLLAFFQPSGTLSNAIGSSSLSSNKFAVSFGANLFSPYDGIGAINGASGNFGLGAYFPNPLFNSLYIGLRQHYGDQKLNGHIRKLSYYPVALSSSSLVALTS